MNITDQIDLQGLRKSGQMHKIRLTKNNYQLVAANAGQSPEVLMHHYNEALEVEKQQLAYTGLRAPRTRGFSPASPDN